MLQKIQNRLNLVLGSIPVFATLTVTASPSIAATFASASANFALNDFSHAPSNVGVITDDDLILSSTSGSVDGLVDFEAIFIETNPFASNFSFALVEGEGQEYVGIANAEATVIGNNFLVAADETFSFNFLAELDLETTINPPPRENVIKAIAEGNISFFLFDNGTDTLLDFFTVSGRLETDDIGDIFAVEQSSNFSLLLNDPMAEFGGNEEFIAAAYLGEFSRVFSEDTSVTLVALTSSHAFVKAPEPSSVVAFFVFGVTGVALRKRKQS